MLDWTPEAVRTWNFTKEGNVRNTIRNIME
jgi:hypothetical protein